MPGMVLGAQNTALNRSQKPCSFLIKPTVLMGKGRQEVRYGNRNMLVEYASDMRLKQGREVGMFSRNYFEEFCLSCSCRCSAGGRRY